MRCLRYSVPYIAGKNQPKDSDPAPCGAGPLSHCSSSGAIQFQSTRPLRGGTAAVRSVSGLLDISIHPPLAGRDPLHRNALRPIRDFNPPAPCGAGPLRVDRVLDPVAISIHPPLAGRDAPGITKRFIRTDFNPPAPCGAGRDMEDRDAMIANFNPPAPCGAGRLSDVAQSENCISIHPPLAGRDLRPRSTSSA